MKPLEKKIILEEPVEEIVKSVLTEDSLIHDEPIVEPKTIEEPMTIETPDLVTPEASDKSTETPTRGSDFGVASMLNADIIDEFEAIDFYNSHIVTLKDLISQEQDENIIDLYEKIIEILTDIVNEENIHVGQLQKALSLVSPSALFIKDGDIEADETLEEK